MRRAALVDALTLQFASDGLTRATVERAVVHCLERAQNLAAVLKLEYFESQRIWETRANARVLFEGFEQAWRQA